MKTDSELQRDVLDELAWEPSVDAAEIGVSVENGIVILNGTVKSLTQKWTAERVAQRVDGVRAVTDELVVKLAGDSQLTDADIAQAAVNCPRLEYVRAVQPRQSPCPKRLDHSSRERGVSFPKDRSRERSTSLEGCEGCIELDWHKPSRFRGGCHTRDQEGASSSRTGGRRKDLRGSEWRQGDPPWKRKDLGGARGSGAGSLGRTRRVSRPK